MKPLALALSLVLLMQHDLAQTSPPSREPLPPLVSEKQAPPDDEGEEPPSTLTGEWNGARTSLRNHGIELNSFIILDDTWNVAGGRRKTPAKGDGEYLFDLNLKATSEKLCGYSGGTFFIDYQNHHGKSPSIDSVGSFVPIDTIEAPALNALYALWYKQVFGDDRAWFLVGKSDAYDNFSNTAHSALFINSGYTTIPTILFMPTYPNPAMSVIVSASPVKGASLTFGLFDGSLAEGNQTGNKGVFGRFFSHLRHHAFLIGEANYEWDFSTDYTGRLGIGGWRETATVTKFNGDTQKGTSGYYLTLDQVLYAACDSDEELGLFLIYGYANPTVSAAERYYAGGLCWEAFICSRPDDAIGVGIGSTQFSKQEDAGFTEAYETSYEIFYKLGLAGWCYLQPDYQYIVHPGGQGLPNASAITARLKVIF